jgi:hypothetical protein
MLASTLVYLNFYLYDTDTGTVYMRIRAGTAQLPEPEQENCAASQL